MSPRFKAACVGLLCLVIYAQCNSLPEGPPLPLDQHRKTRDTDQILSTDSTESTTNGTRHIESRQGRIGPTQTRLIPTRPPVQSHRSSVNYANSVSNGNRPQGPPAPSVSRISAPAPPQDEGPLPPAVPIEVTDIRCLQTTSRELFKAVISTPNGVSSAPPVFESRPSLDPSTSTTCQISPTEYSGRYRMTLSNLDYCGVTTCAQDGQSWLCLTLRFPVVAGLKLPEDEIVVVRCKPQDRTVEESKDIDFSGAESMRIEPKTPVMFTGGRQEFQCEIGLFRKLPGTSKLQQIHSGVAVELGEEVQLKSVVRSNDGWYHSKMTDVVVRRLKQQANSVSDGSATLVLSDGCRNPMYKAIAPQHPERDGSNSLLNSFNFRVFLFQDMEDGDSILISAKVIACVEAIDCAPSLCADNRSQGFGRKRRSVSNETKTWEPSASLDGAVEIPGRGKTREILIQQILYPNGTQIPVSPNHPLKGWETDLALRVAMPGEFYSQRNTPLDALGAHCFLYLILTVAMATALGVTVILLTVYCTCTYKRGKDSQTKPMANLTTTSCSVPPNLETLMEVCYPELQVLDALSRSVRLKKQQVHREMLDLYSTESTGNVYTCEPTNQSEAKTLRQIKRGRSINPVSSCNAIRRPNVTSVTIGPPRLPQEDHYWEIGPPKQIFPPTKV